MVEAVMFFADQKISKQMLYPEFEAVLDGVVNIPEFTDQQMHAAYVLINPRLLVRSLVFFYIGKLALQCRRNNYKLHSACFHEQSHAALQ